jgi:hypothetical protein
LRKEREAVVRQEG